VWEQEGEENRAKNQEIKNKNRKKTGETTRRARTGTRKKQGKNTKKRTRNRKKTGERTRRIRKRTSKSTNKENNNEITITVRTGT
jgi:hypothetical protein